MLLVGPESLLRQSSNLGVKVRSDGYIEGDGGDAIEAHEWKCVRTIDGIYVLACSHFLDRLLIGIVFWLFVVIIVSP